MTSPYAAETGTERPYLMAVVVGANGFGKSSLLQTWVDEALKRGRDVIILDPTENVWNPIGTWIPDDPKRPPQSPKAKAEQLLMAIRRDRRGPGKNPKPALLICDDSDTYTGSAPRDVWTDLIATHRHWKLDVVFVARRPQDLPKIVFTSSQYVYLFRSREVYSNDYLRQYIGAKLAKQIPTERFQYLEIDVDTMEGAHGKTKQRAQKTNADT